MITLYHGTNMPFDTIDLKQSKRYKDFNRAFYLSDSKVQAQEMANSKAEFLGGEPIVYAYVFDDSLLSDAALNVKIFPHYSEEWAEFIWRNRDENQDFTHNFDIVYGPIANDTIGLQIREFKRKHKGDIKSFLKGIKYIKGETFQYAFCTEEAIKYLKRI